jgi:hypothetical protein
MCQTPPCTENIQSSQFPYIDTVNLEWKLDGLASTSLLAALELPIIRGHNARSLCNLTHATLPWRPGTWVRIVAKYNATIYSQFSTEPEPETPHLKPQP